MPQAAPEALPPAPLPFALVADGVRVRLRVTPRARRAGIDGLVADADGSVRLKVAVTAAAEDGRANAAVLALLAAEWRLPRRALRLESGAADRRKTVHIAGEPGPLLAALRGWTEALGRGRADPA
ncbi:MAG TPA: DUF167 family protein [Rhodospirillales bacterium]|nr:DUF167 family protein [Rhodospirillales bacterium]